MSHNGSGRGSYCRAASHSTGSLPTRLHKVIDTIKRNASPIFLAKRLMHAARKICADEID